MFQGKEYSGLTEAEADKAIAELTPLEKMIAEKLANAFHASLVKFSGQGVDLKTLTPLHSFDVGLTVNLEATQDLVSLVGEKAAFNAVAEHLGKQILTKVMEQQPR
ncbi:hypothetical protein [Delftia phage PhiW-14]|uniref:Uncharacterized protein n=1 Tax=Delftia phage PhiW-14 TaxID=665032 RepID=C9DG09_BPW14|nr:hypothetical protein DP-phiW-14_gp037 [Delftia phage PhiW-14]ACV50060.1 hypothetical protein [Delftia phage PhiW-14]